MKTLLVVMAKEPVPGKVKTRLSPALSPVEAASLYDCFLQDRLKEMSDLSDVDKAIAYMPESATLAFNRYASGKFSVFPQKGQHLGERMHHIFIDKFGEGYSTVIVIGSDSPDLPKSIVSKAFDILRSETTDMVLGPATDGGYYLIGLKKGFPELFTDITWSTDTVLSATLEKAKALVIKTELLPIWSDIDEYQDLVTFYNRYKKPVLGQYQVAAKTIAYLKQIKALGCL